MRKPTSQQPSASNQQQATSPVRQVAIRELPWQMDVRADGIQLLVRQCTKEQAWLQANLLADSLGGVFPLLLTITSLGSQGSVSGAGNQGEGAPKRHPIIIRNPSPVPHLVQPPCFFACLPGSRRAGCPHGPHGFFSVISLATVARHRHHTAQGSSQPGKKRLTSVWTSPNPLLF